MQERAVALDRRRFLARSAYGTLAAQLNFAFGAHAKAAPAAAWSVGGRTIDACILLIYYGGPSHLDSWDMKPAAPAEIRGPFRPIATSVPGRFVCEHLPKTARVVDRLALVRTMHHPMSNHNAAMFAALAGRVPVGGDQELLGVDRGNDFPCYGSALRYLIDIGQLPAGPLPLPHVMHNVVPLAGQNAGFLTAKYDPLQVTQDPSRPNFRIDELHLPSDVSAARLGSRRELLTRLSHAAPRTGAIGDSAAVDAYQNAAFDLLHSARVRRAFKLGHETDAARDRYGRHTLGQSLLLARRLVESGVRFVNVNDKVHNGQLANWDSHQDNFARHKDALLPPADQAYSALIEDLDQRGLLDSTLVIAMGEFGRTPKINANAGRDHWPNCYSVTLAGGGVHGGAVYGSSDRYGAHPESSPVSPGDLAATIFWRFGLDHTLELHDQLGRPHRLASGEPLRTLFA